MKKILTASFCALLCTIIAEAQTLIPKFGAALSNISVSKDATSQGTDIKNKLGIVGGVGFEFMLGKKIALQPELLFHQKGYKTSLSQSNTNYESSVTLNYLELPVLVKVKFGSFYVNAGPYVAMGLGGKYKSKASGLFNGSVDGKVKFGKAPDNDTSNDVYIDNTIDAGVQIGGGYLIANKIMIDLRYGFGLTNIADKDASSGYNDNKSKLRSFQVTVGVPLRFGAK